MSIKFLTQVQTSIFFKIIPCLDCVSQCISAFHLALQPTGKHKRRSATPLYWGIINGLSGVNWFSASHHQRSLTGSFPKSQVLGLPLHWISFRIFYPSLFKQNRQTYNLQHLCFASWSAFEIDNTLQCVMTIVTSYKLLQSVFDNAGL